jgi:hypothetical protein
MRGSFTLESELHEAFNADSRVTAIIILQGVDHPGLSATKLAQTAKAQFPNLFETLKIEEDADVANLLTIIAFTLFSKKTYTLAFENDAHRLFICETVRFFRQPEKVALMRNRIKFFAQKQLDMDTDVEDEQHKKRRLEE